MLASAFVLALLNRFSLRRRPPASAAIVSAVATSKAYRAQYSSMTSNGEQQGGAKKAWGPSGRASPARGPGAGPATAPSTSNSLLRMATNIVLHIPLQLYEYFFPSAAEGCPLAERSMLLLCVLVNNCRDCPSAGKAGGPQGVPWTNPFRESFVAIANEDQFAPRGGGGAISFDWTPRIPFETLFQAFEYFLNGGKGAIMLYSLLHSNRMFLDFVLARDDLDTVVLPLLETMYNTPSIAPSHLYVILILMLVLSEDVAFNEGAHRRMAVPNVPWLKERAVNNISLGSLTLIIMLRTLQYNSTRAMDSFVHENCFAILSNMAPHIRGIHSYAAQRLMSLLDVIGRRRKRVVERDGDADNETRLCGLLLELLGVALRPQMLAHNLELMYALLHRREIVDNLAIDTDEEVSKAATSMLSMINFFERTVAAEQATLSNAAGGAPADEAAGAQESAGGQEPLSAAGAESEATRAARSESSPSTWSSEVVMGILERAQRQWYKQRNAAKLEPGELDILGKDTVLFGNKYAYEEVENPESFFLPYIWSMIYDHTPDLWWDSDKIVLFPVMCKKDEGSKDEAGPEAQ